MLTNARSGWAVGNETRCVPLTSYLMTEETASSVLSQLLHLHVMCPLCRVELA